jgi:hypothetical protein
MAALLVRGVGLGVVTVPLMALGFRSLARDQVPDASIITRIAQQVGGSFGTAVLAVILTGAATSATALTSAFQQSFWWAIGFTGAGVLISLSLPGRPSTPADAVPAAADETPVPARWTGRPLLVHCGDHQMLPCAMRGLTRPDLCHKPCS